VTQRWLNVETTSKLKHWNKVVFQRWNNGVLTLTQRWNNVKTSTLKQRQNFNVESTLSFNVKFLREFQLSNPNINPTKIQRLNLTLFQRWFNVGVSAGYVLYNKDVFLWVQVIFLVNYMYYIKYFVIIIIIIIIIINLPYNETCDINSCYKMQKLKKLFTNIQTLVRKGKKENKIQKGNLYTYKINSWSTIC